MLTLYDKYKAACPNSVLGKGQVTPGAMRGVIRTAERNERQKADNLVALPSKAEILAYEQWKSRRAVRSIDDLRQRERQEIGQAINKYLAAHPNTKAVYLSGSYAAGSWIDEFSTEKDRAIRSRHKICKPVSDIDLIPVPFYGAMQVGRVEFTEVPKGKRVLVFTK